jgi:Carbohydrate family 9 binding domain-like/Domain of unknown function (DUF5916)
MRKNHIITTAMIAILVISSTALIANVTFEPIYNPELFVTVSNSEVKIDGNLEDAKWRHASRIDYFHERNPGDNVAPNVKTEVMITYDKEKLYVAFLCYDDPSAIRATMCQRDQFHGDDAVCLYIDTYGEASWAYEFFVNPYGIQKDMLWSNIAGEDSGFDLIWESAAEITDTGYQVEMAIPFASMRFPNKEDQSWKVDFWRVRPRESYQQLSWAAYDRNEQCWTCQWGTIEGIKDVQPGKGFEIMPTLVSTQSSNLNDYGDPNSGLNNSSIDGEFSLGGKYSVSSNVILEAAYNPDFSQIEADAAQIDVNSTIALFYPERRPFFQEGSDLFRTLFNSFYTRTVNDPQYAIKLTGRMGKNSFGVLSARDENTPYMIPLDESSILINSGKSSVNAIRGLRTIGNDSQLGLLMTDRRLSGGGSGSIFALDGDIRLSRNYSFDGQWILSHTDEPDDSVLTEGFEDILFDNNKYTAAFDGESYYGTAFISRFKRNARHWNFILDYNQVSPSYRTETGYDPLINYRNASIFSSYHIRPENSVFVRISPMIYTARRWDFDGLLTRNMNNVSLNTQLKYAQTNIDVSYFTGSENWGGEQFDGLWSANIQFNSQLNDQLGYYASFQRGKGIARYELAYGNETSFFAALDFKPFDRLIIQPNFNYMKSTNSETGDEFYEGYITRTRIRYQANRELSIRFVLQYNDFSRKWDIDPLLTYRLSPFSVFYAGSTFDYNDFNVGPNDDKTKWVMSSRQFFMKIQYLFRT